MIYKKKEINEIIDSNGDLIGNKDIPTSGADLESQANNTTDYNAKIGTQPFRYDMLGRFGFTLMPFMEGKEENQGQKELINDLAKLMYDKYMETLEYYYRNPNKLKSDFRMHSEHDFENQPEDRKKMDFDWAKKAIKVIQPHFEKAFKEPENIDESYSYDNDYESDNPNENINYNIDCVIEQGEMGDYSVRCGGRYLKHENGFIWDFDDALELCKKYLDDDEINPSTDVWFIDLNNKRHLIYSQGRIDKIDTHNMFTNEQTRKVSEDKMIDSKSEDEISKKTEDSDIKDKKLEKVAGLINKLDKKDIDKLINLLERKK